MSDQLTHYGVKGMKWGKRKERYNSVKARSSRTTRLKAKNGDELELSFQKNVVVSSAAARAFLSKRSYDKTMANAKDINYLDVKVRGKSVGEVQFYRSTKDPNDLYVNWLSVSDKHRGKGYASAVFDGVVKHAKDNNYKSLSLEVPGHSPDARHIYESRGFKAVGKVPDPLNTWGGLTAMKYDVSPKEMRHASYTDEDFELALEYAFALDPAKTSLGLKTKGEDYLAHYGVKGMKWGVSKSQYRSYSEKGTKSGKRIDPTRYAAKVNMGRYYLKGAKLKGRVKHDEEWYNNLSTGKEYIRKNHTLKRVVRGVDENTLSGNLYVAKNKQDAEMYRATIPYIQKKGKAGANTYHTVYQMELKTKKKLAMPSQKERVDTFMDQLNTPGGKQWLKQNGYRGEIDELNKKELGLKYYQRFNKYAGNQDVKFNQQYFNSIKKKGYQALIDDNDAGIWSREPVILLSPKGTVRVTNVRQLSADEINDAQKNILKYRGYKS